MTTTLSNNFSTFHESKSFYILSELRDGEWFHKKNKNGDFSNCLPTLLQELNWHGKLNHICEALPYKKKILKEVDILNTMANLGYEAKPIDLCGSKIDKRLFPCLYIAKDSNNNYKSMVLIGYKTLSFLFKNP